MLSNSPLARFYWICITFSIMLGLLGVLLLTVPFPLSVQQRRTYTNSADPNAPLTASVMLEMTAWSSAVWPNLLCSASTLTVKAVRTQNNSTTEFSAQFPWFSDDPDGRADQARSIAHATCAGVHATAAEQQVFVDQLSSFTGDSLDGESFRLRSLPTTVGVLMRWALLVSAVVCAAYLRHWAQAPARREQERCAAPTD